MSKREIVGLGRTAEILSWNKNQVLKLFRDGWSLSSAKWEENVARKIHETGLPVPAVFGIVEVNARYGIIYERVDGPSMLSLLIAKPEKIEHFADMFAKLHAQMHSLGLTGLPSQRQRLERKIRNAEPLPDDRKNAVLRALRRLKGGSVVCHGDFHPDNILMSSRGPVIIDWSDATRGNPHADIARTLLLLQQGTSPQQANTGKEQISMRSSFIDTYLKSYTKTRPISLEEIELWGLPVAAARLSEGIKEEESRLLSIVETLVQSQTLR